jgi:hypothetical protein
VAPQKSFILAPFGLRQQRHVNRPRTERCPNCLQRLADGKKESRTGVFHQMPTIGDLNGPWQSLVGGLAIGTTAITRDHSDA